jgi:hypothetical protein
VTEESYPPYEPTEEEIQQMQAATEAEASEVDTLVLGQCTSQWRKVAMVVAKLLDVFDEKYQHLPYCYMQARIQKLEDQGLVEVAGNPWAMRHSEVRLRHARSEA